MSNIQTDFTWVLCVPVVVICHSTQSVMVRFLFAAQDKGMTNGDYAFITFAALPSEATSTPWAAVNISEQNLTYRMKAFNAFKEVSKTKLCGFFLMWECMFRSSV